MWNGAAERDVVGKIEELQIGKDERDEGEKSSAEPITAVFLQPILARGRLKVADEINENADDNGEDVAGGEGGNEKRERGEQTGFQINDRDAGKQVAIETSRADFVDRVLDLLGRRAGQLAIRLRDRAMLAQIKHREKSNVIRPVLIARKSSAPINLPNKYSKRGTGLARMV